MDGTIFETQKIVATDNKEKIQIKSIADVENLKQLQYIKDKVQEHFVVITLDTKKMVRSIELVGIGSKNSIYVDVLDVIRPAIIRGASSIIIAHNHPSGDSTPSRADIYFTKKINTICAYHNIQFLDHIVFGEKNFSFAQEELIDIDRDFYKLENDVIKELKTEIKNLKSKIEKLENKQSIKDKIEKAKKQTKQEKRENNPKNKVKELEV